MTDDMNDPAGLPVVSDGGYPREAPPPQIPTVLDFEKLYSAATNQPNSEVREMAKAILWLLHHRHEANIGGAVTSTPGVVQHEYHAENPS